MSGIAGIVHTDGRSVDAAAIGRLAAAAACRGFDGTATWHDGPAGLVRHRHATTPEASGERQPRPDDASGMVIAFDGRLDNRGDLLALLGRAGEPLKPAPDCEIALALFEARGDAFLDLLVGDWALAIWTPRSRRLLCARSPMGWRPLLWTFDGKRFAFSTEPRALIVGLGLPRAVNEGVVAEHLSIRPTRGVETLWCGINRVPQGDALSLERGTLRRWHWHDARVEDLRGLSDAGHVERFAALFDTALIAAGRSSTGISAQLSGGLDSSSVVSRSTLLHRAGRMKRQVEPVSVRFPGERYDETEWSSRIEAHLGITATVIGATPFDPQAARDFSARTLLPPVRPNAASVTLGVCDLARARGHRVVLTGEGGDDWMNGSRAHWPDLLRGGHVARVLGEAFAPGAAPSIARALRALGGEAVLPLISRRRRERVVRRTQKGDEAVPDWIDPGWARETGLLERWRADAVPVPLRDIAWQQRRGILDYQRRQLLWDSILAGAEERGVELRHPINDLRLIRFYLGAAGGMLQRGGVRRHILREAMREVLPEAVRTRTTKVHFNSLTLGANAQLFAERPVGDMEIVKRGWIDGARLKRLQDSHVAWNDGGGTGPRPDGPLTPIWYAQAIELWLDGTGG